MVSPTVSPILIVDDEPSDVFVASRLLAKAGIGNPIMTARDGEEAIAALGRALLADELPSVVLLDIRMPRVDGFEVLQWMRQQDKLRYLPVVMFTTSCLSEERGKAGSLGASFWCHKFPSPEKLRAMIESC